MELSILVKARESGQKNLQLWGKVTTSNGKVSGRSSTDKGDLRLCEVHHIGTKNLCLQDYLVATNFEREVVVDGKTHGDLHVCASQDGVQWVDLATVSPQVSEMVAKDKSFFTGEPSHLYSTQASQPLQVWVAS